jgi:nucleoside-diphosphate-sugar epimerase
MVTGAAGGIGSTVCNSLDFHGHKLTMIDNLEYGYIENIKYNRQYDNFYKYDIRELNPNKFQPTIEYDAILHLAAITSLPECENNVQKTISVNLEGTANILEFARKRNIPYVFFTSTSAVYENNKQDTLEESYPVSPRLWYSLSKKMSEDLCESYRNNYGMTITTARLFNVFGSKQDMYRKNPPLINYLVREFINNRQPILHSTGLQRRDYINIDDVIGFLNSCLVKQPNMILNVCTGKTITVRDIVDIVRKTLNVKIEPIYRDATMLWDSYPELFSGNYSLSKDVVFSETNKVCRGSNLLAQQILGWKPSIEIDESIQQTVLKIKDNI